MLYLFPFLHQATTLLITFLYSPRLYLFPFLHQATTCRLTKSSCFMLYLFPFLHQATTFGWFIKYGQCCISSLFYIKPQPCRRPSCSSSRCISSLFYIKPQLEEVKAIVGEVVSLPFSTSSHNKALASLYANVLYLFPFLHQATTQMATLFDGCRCISSLFYIKPQREPSK